MYEWSLLGLVAAGFYLLECCAWISRPCWACFRHPLHGRWRPGIAADLLGNDRGGILLSAPFDVSGTVVQCCEWPFTVSPDGIANASVTDDELKDAEFIAFDDITSVRCLLETVLITDRPFVTVSSPVWAVELTRVLQRLTSARRREREKLIRSTFSERVNLAAVKERWQSFHGQTRALRRASLLALLWLFVAAPAAFLLFGPLAAWPFLLAGVLAGALISAVLYVRTHKRLFNVAASDRWIHAVAMTLFPPAGFRACDRLAKELLWSFEPVAVVAAFCNLRASAGAVRPAVFDICKNAAPTTPSSDLMACRAWHQDALKSEITTLLRGAGVDPLAAPAPEDASMNAFCPRCHTQYSEGRETCAACADVTLVPFSAAALSH